MHNITTFFQAPTATAHQCMQFLQECTEELFEDLLVAPYIEASYQYSIGVGEREPRIEYLPPLAGRVMHLAFSFLLIIPIVGKIVLLAMEHLQITHLEQRTVSHPPLQPSPEAPQRPIAQEPSAGFQPGDPASQAVVAEAISTPAEFPGDPLGNPLYRYLNEATEQDESKTLELSHLTSVPPDIFSLPTFNLCEKFRTLPADAIQGPSDIKSLHLDKGSLKALPPNIFELLKNSSTLELRANGLQTLSKKASYLKNAFTDFSALQKSHALNNPLLTIQQHLFVIRKKPTQFTYERNELLPAYTQLIHEKSLAPQSTE